MPRLGVQTLNVVEDDCPLDGNEKIKNAGFDTVDFSLHDYLTNKDIYGSRINHFFEKSTAELEEHFAPHKQAIEKTGLTAYQMHMPYPVYAPRGSRELNEYLRKNVAPKSLYICKFFNCKYIVVHGFKLAYYVGSEEEEWAATENFLEELAPLAKELGVTLCIENLYDSLADRLTEGPCCDAKKAVERIDRINDEHKAEVLGFCFDTGHANLVHLDIADFLITLGGRLKTLHIHDNDGWRDLHQIPFAFTKTRQNKAATDWEGFIRGLGAIGYDGSLNFETGPALMAFPRELQEDTLRFIARIGKYFADNIDKT